MHMNKTGQHRVKC